MQEIIDVNDSLCKVFYLYFYCKYNLARRLLSISERKKALGKNKINKMLGGIPMNEITLFDSLFNDGMGGIMNVPVYNHTAFMPKVDVKEDLEAYTVEMDLPGRNEQDVDIELDHNTLIISSKKEENRNEEAQEKKEKGKWLIRERRISSFRRSFTLPDDVNLEEVKASFKNGILFVRLPRRALPQPKKIAIEAV